MKYVGRCVKNYNYDRALTLGQLYVISELEALTKTNVDVDKGPLCEVHNPDTRIMGAVFRYRFEVLDKKLCRLL